MTIATRLALLSVAAPLLSLAQAPIINGRIETRPVSGGLTASIRAAAGSGPHWIAYTVPAVAGAGSGCCYSNSGSVCGLEEGRRGQQLAQATTVRLEGDRETSVLLRYESGQLTKVQAFSGECTLDAGGLPVTVFTGVAPGESVAFLEPLARDPGDGANDSKRGSRIGDGAIHAIGRHAGPAADRALEKLAAPDQPERIRSKTAFWLGSTRGAAGVSLLDRMAKQDPSDKVREQVAFAYSVSREPQALTALIRLSKEDKSPRVRGQGLFWLAQKAGQRAVASITEAVQDDPDTEVKKKAVFALSQLPAGDGVPKLIDVARTNRNPEVRKQAIFWLGQSKDRRAAEFIEALLLK